MGTANNVGLTAVFAMLVIGNVVFTAMLVILGSIVWRMARKLADKDAKLIGRCL